MRLCITGEEEEEAGAHHLSEVLEDLPEPAYQVVLFGVAVVGGVSLEVGHFRRVKNAFILYLIYGIYYC